MEIAVLGPLQVSDAEGPVRLDAAMQRRLLATLVAAAGDQRSTDLLIDVLWGTSPPPSAPKLLQIYISRLRKALPSPEKIETSAGGYRLDLDGVALDSARFEGLLGEGKAVLRQGNPALAASLLGKALALWRGPAYADFAYDDFAGAEAQRLEELRQIAVEERLDACLALCQHDDVLGELLALAHEHPARERLQCQAMLALYRAGRQSEALDLYARLRRQLLEDLGLEPAPELRALQRRILQHDPSLLAPTRPDTPQMQLPLPPNPLVGRERELADLASLLVRDDVRLLVLTGAGGSGKTRLALEAARRSESSFANGAAFVDLAPLRDPQLVVGEIARSLRVREKPGQDPLETLAAGVQSHELLVVIDNAEHLRTATPVFVELIRRTTRVTILVTSRAVLHLSGEHVYPLEPLEEAAANALFFARAREANARLTLEAEAEELVRGICRRLDGLPLAIELAASHVRVLSLRELFGRLDSRLPLLTGGPRDLPARQQTLRATLEWTFGLLDDQERRDLMRLAVFAGSWTLEAAEFAAGTTIARIGALVDHNLIRRTETAAGSRFTMLETVREFALEHLDATAGAEAARGMHARYYLKVAEAGAVESPGLQGAFFASAERELDNLRVAFRWLQDHEPPLALRLAAALSTFWIEREHLLEGRRSLEEVVGQQHPPSRELAVAAAAVGRILFALGELEAADEPVKQALELAEALQLPGIQSDVLNTHGLLLDFGRRYDEAQADFERALSIARSHSLEAQELRSLYNLANMLDEQDDHRRARVLDLQGVELCRKTDRDDRRFLGNLIWRNAMLGDWDAALDLSEELERTPGTRPGQLGEALGAAWIQVQRGQIIEARHQLDQRWDLNRMQHAWSRLCHSVAEAVVLRAEGRLDDALATLAAISQGSPNPRHDGSKMAFVEAVEAAFALGDLDRVRKCLDGWSQLAPPDQSPFMKAQYARFAARLSTRLGRTAGVESAFVRATKVCRELSMPFYIGVTLLEHAEWLEDQGRGHEAATQWGEAAEIFGQLRATPWLERGQRLSKKATEPARTRS